MSKLSVKIIIKLCLFYHWKPLGTPKYVLISVPFKVNIQANFTDVIVVFTQCLAHIFPLFLLSRFGPLQLVATSMKLRLLQNDFPILIETFQILRIFFKTFMFLLLEPWSWAHGIQANVNIYLILSPWKCYIKLCSLIHHGE